MDDLKAVWVKKLCYVWVAEKYSFLKLVGLDNSISKSHLHKSHGFSEFEQAKK